MAPLQALTPTDFGKLFTPQITAPPIVGLASSQSNANSNLAMYVGLGLVIVIVVAGGIYLLNKNQKFKQELSLKEEENLRLASYLLTNSINSKTNNDANKSNTTDQTVTAKA